MKIELFNIQQLADIVQAERKKQNVTQVQLSQLANVGVRFVRDLEDGKSSMHIDKVFSVLETLGIKLELTTIEEDDE
jgi:y4mF family transcriptional regulator